ncbi:hypothetical protein HPB47_027052, partial [Ixodes persulcatus]
LTTTSRLYKTACSTLKKLSQPCDQETQVTFRKFKRHLPYVAAHPTKLRYPRLDVLTYIPMDDLQGDLKDDIPEHNVEDDI